MFSRMLEAAIGFDKSSGRIKFPYWDVAKPGKRYIIKAQTQL
jgi:hypothetical protein